MGKKGLDDGERVRIVMDGVKALNTTRSVKEKKTNKVWCTVGALKHGREHYR